MKKRLLTLIMAGFMAMSLMVGCGSDDTETAGNNVSNEVESNDNTATNNDTDSNAEIDTTKQEETEEIEYSEDDVIIELNGAKFSIYDEWSSIEPKLQEAGFDTSHAMSDDRITNNFNDGEELYIMIALLEENDGIFIKTFQIEEHSGKDSIRKKIKINGYNMLETDKIIKKYQFEDGKDDGFITSDIKLNTSAETTYVYWRMTKHSNK